MIDDKTDINEVLREYLRQPRRTEMSSISSTISQEREDSHLLFL